MSHWKGNKEWSNQMSSEIVPPGHPVHWEEWDAQEHESFMSRREKFLREVGYYLDPYVLIQMLFPDTFDMVMKTGISLHDCVQRLSDDPEKEPGRSLRQVILHAEHV